MDKNKIIYDRNRLVTKLLWFSLLLGLMADIVNDAPPEAVVSLVAIGLLCAGTSTILTYKRIFEFGVRYIVLLGLSLLAYFIIYFSPHIANYLLLYYCLGVVTLYHDFGLIIVKGIINLFFTNYFFSMYRDTMFIGLQNSNLVTLNLFLILTTLVLAFQSKIGADMRKTLEKNNRKSKETNMKLEEIFEHIGITAKTLNDFSQNFTKNIDPIRKISKIVKESFTEIASSIETQAQGVCNINKSMFQSKDKIAELSAASVNMREISATTSRVSNDGNKEIGLLKEEFKRVDTNIEDTICLMNDLNKKTGRIGNILNIIAEVANQTDLLALNATVEAARAGEHGSSFSIVAEEIGKFAENSKISTEEISQILNEVGKK